ncbi:hypothetical protein HMY34_03510 [Thiothrix subterranea]|uniref:translation initiation factor IF-2 associated domain-containing protein n=1 Tax=Thiothrix subterranea TaxID=2735563 RepID=UPI001AF32794|nr:translation initiation factor IF-2 associated domain-containing protein [Thiothrix subterranea]QQZ27895.1 hypothetical protein HMY34_03510 [Thiothrix subterranea]
MSDIAVKKLAEIINAPVEVLLKQLQDAGIHVDGPDAWITDAQKFKLLAHIRQGAAPVSTGGNKITIKRRSTSEMTVGAGGARSKTVSVEVRHKKTFTPGVKPAEQSVAAEAPSSPAPVAPASASAPVAGARLSRTEELARQLSAERQARESAVQKSGQDRRQQENKRMERQAAAATAAVAMPQPAPAPAVTAVVNEAVTPVMPASAPAPVVAVTTPVPEVTVAVSKPQESVKPVAVPRLKQQNPLPQCLLPLLPVLPVPN